MTPISLENPQVQRQSPERSLSPKQTTLLKMISPPRSTTPEYSYSPIPRPFLNAYQNDAEDPRFALIIEGLFKNGKISKEIAERPVFVNAAMLTLQKNESLKLDQLKQIESQFIRNYELSQEKAGVLESSSEILEKTDSYNELSSMQSVPEKQVSQKDITDFYLALFSFLEVKEEPFSFLTSKKDYQLIWGVLTALLDLSVETPLESNLLPNFIFSVRALLKGSSSLSQDEKYSLFARLVSSMSQHEFPEKYALEIAGLFLDKDVLSQFTDEQHDEIFTGLMDLLEDYGIDQDEFVDFFCAFCDCISTTDGGRFLNLKSYDFCVFSDLNQERIDYYC